MSKDQWERGFKEGKEGVRDGNHKGTGIVDMIANMAVPDYGFGVEAGREEGFKEYGYSHYPKDNDSNLDNDGKEDQSFDDSGDSSHYDQSNDSYDDSCDDSYDDGYDGASSPVSSSNYTNSYNSSEKSLAVRDSHALARRDEYETVKKVGKVLFWGGVAAVALGLILSSGEEK